MGSFRNPPERPNDPPGSRREYRNPAVRRRIYLPPVVRLRGAGKVLRLAASRHMGLEEIARVFGVSREHLLRLFREAGHFPPMRQVRRLELRVVLERMRTTDESVETLARQFGYADGSSLRRALRRAFGQPPGVLRNDRHAS